MMVHIFGAIDSPCCATYTLRRADLDQRESFRKEKIDTVLHNFYVDDLLKSVTTEKEASDLIPDLEKLLHNRGFNLTKFNCSVNKVLSKIQAEKLANKSSVQFEHNITRALGMKWHLSEDCFLYNLEQKLDNGLIHSTKREILKKTVTVFDPLGFLTPFTLIAKLILQTLWKENISWDERVDENIQSQWEGWLNDLSQITSSIQIPRSMDIEFEQNFQVHLFCDASERVFAAVAYLRVKRSDGKISYYIVLAKSRVAPLKKLTLPRLELQGAVLAVRLKETIVKEIDLKFDRINFWTDSMLNSQYINNHLKRFKVFVGNRVAEISEHSDKSQWRFVPGKLNPADLATRGTNLKDAAEVDTWLNGPSFLLNDEEYWPSVTKIQSLDEDDEEIRSNYHVKSEETDFVDFNNFLSWRRLVRMFGWIGVFIKNCTSNLTKCQSRQSLTPEEESQGKLRLIKLVQRESFHEEINNLTLNKPIRSNLTKLDPFLDNDGILRVGGRLKRGTFPYAAKHQIILSSKHQATLLLVRHLHDVNLHVGAEHLLALARQEYWIVGGRVLIKQIKKRCVPCQKRNAKPSSAIMADLLEDRIAASTPSFYSTGVYYFGPIEVKILRSRVKRWGCIFTCLNTRAIHLEVAPSLSFDDFMSVLDRFVCRKACPHIIRSDCGINFKGASNELKTELQMMNNLEIQKSLEQREILWMFNPPEAPHMGGVWERMVQSVKKSLDVILKSGTIVTDYTLMSVFAEVEFLINSRLLAPVSDDVSDLEALTPNHFLIGRSTSKLSPCLTYDMEVPPRQRWRQVHSLPQKFWDRWPNLKIQNGKNIYQHYKQEPNGAIGQKTSRLETW